MVKREGNGKIPAALVLALATGLLVTVMGAAVTAWLIQGQTVGEEAAGIGGMVTVLLAAAASAAVAVLKVPNLRLIMCLAGGGIYLLGLLCCGALLFDGVKGGVLATAAVIAAGCMLIFLVGMRGGRKAKYKVPKLRL